MSRLIIPCVSFGECALCDYVRDNCDIEFIRRSGNYLTLRMRRPPDYSVNWSAVHTVRQICKKCREMKGLPLCRRLPVVEVKKPRLPSKPMLPRDISGALI